MKTCGLVFFTFLLALVVPADEPKLPCNPPAMQPIGRHDTPAYVTAKRFLHGVNLGNYLEAPPGQNWGVQVTVPELARIKKEGFDHVRVPVGWHHYAGPGPEFRLQPVIFGRVDEMVTNALADGLAVMINIHHFKELDENPLGSTDELVTLWRQIATHYQDFPPQLIFEIDNEPHLKATTTLMNPIYARVIAEIRRTNPHRTIVVEPGNWGSIHELKNLVLPPDDNVMVSVHCYEPFHFTHQGASWAGPDLQIRGILFPGPPPTPLVPDSHVKVKPYVLDWVHKYNTTPADRNPSSAMAFRDDLKFTRDWSAYYGRPVHLGEFGAQVKVDHASRMNYYRSMRETAASYGIGWCIWDWSAGFHYWDAARQEVVPGMHAALFDGE